jgi:membrane protein DedA with SNARE-associated domain
MNLDSNFGGWSLAASAFAGTFVSEDLTCIAVGLLVAGGQGDLNAGLVGCFLGIFAGDASLWLLGRVVGRRLLHVAWVRRRLPTQRLEQMQGWLERNAGGAVIAARFLPGARSPFYLSAGIVGRKGGRLLFWTFVAALLWTPLLVLSVAVFGEAAAKPIRQLIGNGGLAIVVLAALAFGFVRLLPQVMNRSERAKIKAKLARLWRWEFWPAWIFYLPLAPWYGWLCLRYRGVTVWTAANPGIPAGGLVGESKAEILAQLPENRVVPFTLLAPGPIAERLEIIRRVFDENCWCFPLILKPDAAQRGAGVKKIHDFIDVEKYLQSQHGAVLVQPYHPGPFEAGVFYYRLPGERSGRIFSITDKIFPAIAGDGCSTLAELIQTHPRYRMQADVFLKRHAAQADRTLAKGESLLLALAGNHCQGTMFRDGNRLITPELERAFDEIAQSFSGFFVGRFDVRYTRLEDFRAGLGFAIVELNGATSESTNLYDPSRSLISAYRILFRQWDMLFRIGHANRSRGHQPLSLCGMLRLLRTYYAGRRIDPLAD